MENKNKKYQPSPSETFGNRDEVARRAHELYEARGAEPGHELDDWLQAEEEIEHSQVMHRD